MKYLLSGNWMGEARTVESERYFLCSVKLSRKLSKVVLQSGFIHFSIWQDFNWISSQSSQCCLTLFRLSSRHNSISYCYYVSSTPLMTSSKCAVRCTSIGLLNRLRNIYRAGECPAHQQFGLLALERNKQKELLLFVSPFILLGSLLFMAMVGCKSEITNIISNVLEKKATGVWCLVSIELINCFSAFSQSSSST